MPLLPRNPDESNKNIRTAWMAGAIQAVIILAEDLIIVASGETLLTRTVVLLFTGQLLVQVLLTLGVFAKSRISAVALLLFFILTSSFNLLLPGFTLRKVIVPALFFTAYLLGVTGTFAWHRDSRRTIPPTRTGGTRFPASRQRRR